MTINRACPDHDLRTSSGNRRPSAVRSDFDRQNRTGETEQRRTAKHGTYYSVHSFLRSSVPPFLLFLLFNLSSCCPVALRKAKSNKRNGVTEDSQTRDRSLRVCLLSSSVPPFLLFNLSSYPSPNCSRVTGARHKGKTHRSQCPSTLARNQCS